MQNKSKKGVASGIFWSTFGKFSINGSNFIVGIILARILTPEDFGITGLILLFVALSRILVEGGFSKALIQNQKNSIIDYSTVFFSNLGVSIILYLILFFTAPIIANFYELPALINITRVSALGIVFLAFTVVPRAQMTIKVDFKTQNLITLIAVALSSVISIVMAYSGFGVWSLVFKAILRTFFAAIFFWIISNWKPILAFSRNSFQNFFRYSIKIMLGDLINIVYHDFLILVIGKIYGSQALGYYTRARSFGDSSSTNMSQIVQLVSFPILSSLNMNEHSFVKSVKKFIRISTFISFPIAAIFFVFSYEIVVILLTSKWIESVPLLRILSLIGFIYPLILMNQNIINTKGNSNFYLIAEIIKISLVILGILFTYKYSIKTMIMGQLIAMSITYIVYTVFSYRLTKYGLFSQLKDVLPVFILTLSMMIPLYPVVVFVENIYLRLSVGLVVSAVLYIGGAFLFRFSEISDVRSLLAKKVTKK